jgi:glycosyltransferase involved in cell wall biosynthesis
MRVVHVTPYFAPAFRYGGPPRSVLGLCKGLQRAGVQVEVLTTAANGPADLTASPPEGSEYDGVAVRYLPVAFPRRFFGARIGAALAAALSRSDLCHIHGLWNVPEWSASRLARAHSVPYVLSPRGMLQPAARRRGRWRKQVAFQLLERANLRGADLLHATSDVEGEALRSLGLQVPVVVVPNGVDVVAAAAAAPGFRARLGIPRDAFVIVFLGRVHPIKRLDLLAQAFASVREPHPAAHLVIAGPDESGYLATVMRQLTAHAGFVHAVDTLGEDDKWALLGDANALVQCSDSESFGLAVVEGMAAGLPVVVTRTCPWPEIEARECGVWVEQSADAIAAAIRRLAADPTRAAAMGARGAAFARERYGWEAIGHRMAECYATIVGERPREHVA